VTIVLLGASPRLAWARSFLEALPIPAGAPLQIAVAQGASTREHLHSLIGQPVDDLVLVDHVPFAGSAIPESGTADAVRDEAQRAILAYELSRRAARTLVLAPDESERWPAALAALHTLPIPAEVAAPPPLPPGAALIGGLSIATYLGPLFAASGEGGPGAGAAALRLSWPREAFLDGDSPGQSLPALVEVAGRARILAYGPYLPLPTGGWHAKAFLGFSPDIGKMSFILEVDTGGAVSRGFFEADRGGIFTLDLDFEVSDALNPIEMRLISQDSALEGQVSLIEVELEHVAAA
jgi:hypothetical protein